MNIQSKGGRCLYRSFESKVKISIKQMNIHVIKIPYCEVFL